jgi:hypothetical protein
MGILYPLQDWMEGEISWQHQDLGRGFALVLLASVLLVQAQTAKGCTVAVAWSTKEGDREGAGEINGVEVWRSIKIG